MAKKHDNTEGKILAVEEALGRTEQFIERNQKVILIVVGIIIVFVLGYFGSKKFYFEPKETKAHSEMFYAEKYFELDSLNQALNGDGEHVGFLDIIDNYGMTDAANLAKYYTGIIYLKQHKFDDAITYLKKYSGKDQIISSVALGSIGDAYMEQNDAENALKYYLQAVDKNDNNFTAPQYLMKAGFVYEEKGDWTNALKMYEQIKKDHYKSQEFREVDKLIARAKGMLNQ